MEILGYGEDSLTLWALRNKLKEILSPFNDNSTEDQCIIFYRPSFGRKGGNKSSQFGEFDFIILSETTIYLGESKWDRTSIKNNEFKIRDEQLRRHKIFKKYVTKWMHDSFSSWNNFRTYFNGKLSNEKLMPDSGTLLAENLEFVLNRIKQHFTGPDPKIKNILLYLYNKIDRNNLNKIHPGSIFKLVKIDYSSGAVEKYIHL